MSRDFTFHAQRSENALTLKQIFAYTLCKSIYQHPLSHFSHARDAGGNEERCCRHFTWKYFAFFVRYENFAVNSCTATSELILATVFYLLQEEGNCNRLTPREKGYRNAINHEQLQTFLSLPLKL